MNKHNEQMAGNDYFWRTMEWLKKLGEKGH